MVSRRHAILERRGEQYVLRDNRSSNGTMVNGDRVSNERPLRDGDLIAIGSARLLFNTGSSAAASPPPSPGALVTQPMRIRPVPSVPAAANSGGVAARSGLSCLACGTEASPFDQFCRQCGEKLPDSSVKQVACKSCHAVVMLPAKFCGSCGKGLLAEAPRKEGSEPVPPSISDQKTPDPLPSPAPLSTAATPRMGGSAVSNAVSKASGSPAPQLADRSPSVVRSVKPSPRPASRLSPRPQLPADEPAGFWIRLAAYSIDSVIVGLPLLLAAGGWAFWVLEQGGAVALAEATPSVFLLPILGGVVTLLLSIVYPVYFWALRGATPGKRILGLRVMSMEGETPIGWQRALLRVIGYMISGFVMGIGFLLIAVSDDKRGLHDRLADTRVLRRS